ncbi:MAG: MBL fold metallo-hydrolase [Dermatophilaceae bacterium]
MNPFDRAPFEHAMISNQVHVLTQPDGGWCLNNVVIHVGGDIVIVVDTMATQRRNAALVDIVEAVRGHRQVLVVNTHFHGDHTFGNGQLRECGLIVASADTRAIIPGAGLHLCGLWPDSDWGDIRPCLPDVSFTGSMDVWDGDDVLRLREFRNAHTASDVAIWNPSRRALYAGDLLMHQVTPFFLMGTARGYLDALQALQALRPELVVPGHGPVGGPEMIEQNAAYVRWCVEYGTETWHAGVDPLEAAQRAELGRFAGWADPERLVGNLHSVHADLANRPVDLEAALADSFRYSPDAMRSRV